MTTKRNLPVSIPRSAGTITSTSWTAPADLTFEQWMVAGKALASVRSTIIWVLADWWVHGEHAYGERVKALREGDISDLKFETIMTYGSVARRVGTSMRIEALSFSHHRQVAIFDNPETQRHWLERATAEGWSLRRLHDEITQSQLASQTQDNDDGDAIEEDEASDLGAPIGTGGGDDEKTFRTEILPGPEHPIEEPKPIAPPPGPTSEQHDRHLLTTFHQFAGGLYFLVNEPLQVFTGTSLPPSRLRTIAAFLERVADAIEGRLPAHDFNNDEKENNTLQ